MKYLGKGSSKYIFGPFSKGIVGLPGDKPGDNGGMGSGCGGLEAFLKAIIQNAIANVKSLCGCRCKEKRGGCKKVSLLWTVFPTNRQEDDPLQIAKEWEKECPGLKNIATGAHATYDCRRKIWTSTSGTEFITNLLH